MQFTIRTLAIATMLSAVAMWCWLRNDSSVERANWGTVRRIPAGDLSTTPAGVNLWYYQRWPFDSVPDGVVAICDPDKVTTVHQIRSCFKNGAKPPAIHVAIRTSADVARLSAQPAKAQMLNAVVSTAMAMDQFAKNSVSDVKVDVPWTGRFTISYINDLAEYVTTRIHGPRSVISQYEAACDQARGRFPK